MKQGLPPIAGPLTRVFILGSLPGDRSIEQGQYYAHRTNQFWKLVGSAIGEDLTSRSYGSRLQVLADHRIGLWDVVSAAHREGSADHAIRDAVHNDIGGLKRDYPHLEAIAFNGGKAAKEGSRLLAGIGGLELIALPSSSGLAAIPFDQKARAWARLAEYCGQ